MHALTNSIEMPTKPGAAAGLRIAEPAPRPARPRGRFERGVWWLVHTRARHEKQLAEALDQRGFRYFLPLVRSRRSYGARRREFELPLFPGYLFLNADEPQPDFTTVWNTRHVANVVPISDQARLRAELADVERTLRSCGDVQMLAALPVGQRCRVRSGPLRGLEGTVLRRPNGWRLCVGVTFIGQSAVVEIDAQLLEPVGPF